MKKPPIPRSVLDVAANASHAGEAKEIIKHYREHGCVPEQYRDDYYNAFFNEAKTAVIETQIIH